MASLPPNARASQHPSLKAKLSQLRSKAASPREVKTLVHEISLLLAAEALSTALKSTEGPKNQTPLGFEYVSSTISPGNICIVPILRSGLGMVEAVQTMLPDPVPVHHLGMYREPTTLDPVEYYNNLPQHIPSSSEEDSSTLAIVVDPVIATGGTCAAAISTLREWGAKRVLVLAVVAAEEGLRKAASEWPEGSEIWVAGVDGELTKEGMLKPGLGDVGDRLFLTIGK
ncbi:uracil phosphoribosyltransferase-domain-containing protein [Emericellopsis atlantica]|uniref:uracil phosphoribosyltransferase n=1 Tax=Emericellopsis atlantica TaxID=2614577 RepID=A0A9P7ZHP1_9HYPO|nr:uracil phosphoribosyltransferase-domain-containing protein [Emericellopsis atlantica]KAG9252220.1 uracil phosphoribosyltransferase-domain-containing protein [Emericellopsis atlantica]